MDPRSRTQRLLVVVVLTALTFQSASGPVAGNARPDSTPTGSTGSAPTDPPPVPGGESSEVLGPCLVAPTFNVAVSEGHDNPGIPIEMQVPGGLSNSVMLLFDGHNATPTSADWSSTSFPETLPGREIMTKLVQDLGGSDHDITAFGLREPDHSTHSNSAARVNGPDGRFARAVLVYSGVPGSAIGDGIRATATKTGTSSTPSVTVSGIQPGDLVLAALSYHSGGSHDPNSVINEDPAWTERAYRVSGGTHSAGIHVIEKVATGGSATASWTLSKSRQYTAGIVVLKGAGSCPVEWEQLYGTCSGMHATCPANLEADPVNTATGNYVSSVTDLSLPGRGLGFAFTRTYNSLDTRVSTLGPGWTQSYAARLGFEGGGAVRFFAEDGAQLVFQPDGSGGFAAPSTAFGTLSQLGGGTYELTRRDQIRYRFDASGLLTAMVDRNGNELTLGYSADKLTTVTDTVGRAISLTYHPNGRLATLSGPPSRTVSYAYDGLNRLSTVTDSRGKVWTYTYDAQHRLLTIVDPNNHTVVTNEYGPDGRITAQTDARGKRGTFAWDPATETSTYTDARGKAWIDDYESNVLQSRRDPLGNTTSFGYDADFNVTAITDPRGKTTTQTWDTNGNLLTRTAPAPLSYVETWTYNARNDVSTYTNGRNKTTTYTYNTVGNLIKVTEPLAVETEFGRDPGGTGLLVSITDPRDKVTTYGYDAEANLTSTVMPLGNVTTMGYDAAGRLTSVVDPRGNATGANPADYTTTFSYNATDQVLTTISPLGHVTTFAYDDAGNLTSVTDPNTNATSYGYDAANNLTSVTDAANELTAYGYDNVGNLTTRSDANNHVTTYAYDDANRLTSTTDSLTNVWSLTYDAAGNVATRTDAKDHIITHTYDALNRLTGIAYADPATADVTLAYDANGNPTTLTDGAGTETYVYDDLDRLETVTRGTSTFSYGYDPVSNVTSRTYPDATATTYTYDDDGRMATAVAGSATTTYGYDPAGNVKTIATPDGYVARYAYDRAGRLLEVAHRTDTALLSRFTYELDPAGNRIALTSRLGTVSYRYDDLNRLTGACWVTTCPWGAGATPAACLDCGSATGVSRPADPNPPDPADTFVTYTYDPVGNRLTEATYLGTTSYAYDAADRLTSRTPPGQSAVAYTYDDNGNQLSAGSETFSWDAADRLVSATAGGVTETYTYAGDGRRLSVAAGGSTQSWWWDLAHALPMLALERDGSGAVIRRSTYGLGRIATAAGAVSAYHHSDVLGSVVDVTNAAGTSLSWTEFQPFGAVRTSGLAAGASATPYGFTGEFTDSTGLVHLRARQHDTATGRFLSIDPMAPLLTDPYVGTYVYARSMPTAAVDPSGRFAFLAPLVAIAAPIVTNAVLGVGGYLVSNAVVNFATGLPLDKGLNPVDGLIAAGAGVAAGPLGGLGVTGTKLVAAKVIGGAAIGCGSTLASQQFAGEFNRAEALIGCAFGATGALLPANTLGRSFIYGTTNSVAQGFTTHLVDRQLSKPFRKTLVAGR